MEHVNFDCDMRRLPAAPSRAELAPERGSQHPAPRESWRSSGHHESEFDGIAGHTTELDDSLSPLVEPARQLSASRVDVQSR